MKAYDPDRSLVPITLPKKASKDLQLTTYLALCFEPPAKKFWILASW